MGKTKPANIENTITKNFGDDILINANSLLERKNEIISISPKIDLILGGGIPEGSFVIFTGQAKFGKTSLALNFCSSYQKHFSNIENKESEREIFYYNIEGRLKPRDLQGIKDLKIDNFHIIESKPGKILHAEEYLQIGEMLINDKQNSIHIFDSFSALCTEAEMTTDMNQMQRADGAKLLAKFCRKIANVIPVNKNIIIGITHLMGNPTGYGKQYREKSGQAITYQVDTKLQATYIRPWKDKNNHQIGQEIDWQCITTPLGPPGKTTTSYLRYGEGIDEIQELATLAADLGLIQKAGAWYKFTFVNSNDPPSVHGIDNIKPALLKNSQWFEKLQNKIKQLV